MPDRSFHFIPGNRPEWFAGAGTLGADQLIFDLEDSVPSAEKESARRHVGEHLRKGDTANWFVRIHGHETAEFHNDVTLLREFPTVGLVIPKLSHESDWIQLASCINGQGRRVIVLIESFSAVDTLSALLDSSPWRLYGVGLGLEDLFSSVCFDVGQLDLLVQYVRSRIAIACLARRLAAIDAICGEIRDADEIQRHCLTGRAAGMGGKFTIHPAQVPTVNRVYSPDAAAVQWAQTIAHLSDMDDETGYRRVGDMILTPPKVKKARNILRCMREIENG